MRDVIIDAFLDFMRWRRHKRDARQRAQLCPCATDAHAHQASSDRSSTGRRARGFVRSRSRAALHLRGMRLALGRWRYRARMNSGSAGADALGAPPPGACRLELPCASPRGGGSACSVCGEGRVEELGRRGAHTSEAKADVRSDELRPLLVCGSDAKQCRERSVARALAVGSVFRASALVPGVPVVAKAEDAPERAANYHAAGYQSARYARALAAATVARLARSTGFGGVGSLCSSADCYHSWRHASRTGLAQT